MLGFLAWWSPWGSATRPVASDFLEAPVLSSELASPPYQAGSNRSAASWWPDPPAPLRLFGREHDRLIRFPWAKGLAEANRQQRLRSLEQVLIDMRPDTLLARRIALAAWEMSLLPVARRYQITPERIVGVIRIENPSLRLQAVSEAGAQGLMQVMPFHHGLKGCPKGPLSDIRTNVCHGVKILGDALRRHEGNWKKALLAYNGCVTGSRTPTCHSYPMLVDRATARVESRSRQQSWITTPARRDID